MEDFSWLITVLGVLSLFKGIENLYPRMARTRLKRTLEKSDTYFRAIGLMFFVLGIAVIYIGMR